MATMSAVRHNPAIQAFYHVMLKAGKLRKVALTACMHKMLLVLNAILKTGRRWQADFQLVAA